MYKCKIQVTFRYHLSLRFAKIQKFEYTTCGQDDRQTGLWEHKVAKTCDDDNLAVPVAVIIMLHCDPGML